MRTIVNEPADNLRCEIVELGDGRYLVRVIAPGADLPDGARLVIDNAPGQGEVRIARIPGPTIGGTGFSVAFRDLPQARLSLELPTGERIDLNAPQLRRLAVPDHRTDERATVGPRSPVPTARLVTGRGAASRAGIALLTLLPGVLLVVFSFHAGGFFPGSTSLAVVVLLLCLLARVAFSPRPFAGLSVPYVVVATALGLFASWALASSLWSEAPARALVEYDRALLYFLGFVLMGSLGRDRERLRWIIRAVAAGAVLVCCCALFTRLLPEAWPVAPSPGGRFGYPLTYWNALGLLAALGFVLCFALTCDDRESRDGRVLAAAALPVLAVTMLLTFSRGAFAVAIVGLLALVVAGRPRVLLSGVLVAVPTVWLAVLAGYGADRLATENPTSPVAVQQGEHVALVVLACVLAAVAGRATLLRLDPHVAAIVTRLGRARPRVRWGMTAVGVLATLVLVLALSLPSTVGREYERFVDGSPVDVIGDLRPRLTRSGDNGRLELWRIALAGFGDHPLHGTGAGTYALQWDRRRQEVVTEIEDAHSLYAEVLGELGIVGLLLLVTALIVILGGFLRLARGPDRALGGVLFAAGAMWVVHAGTEWDWEMPAVSFWLFALGGAALAAETDRTRVTRGRPVVRRRLVRVVAAIACLVLIVAPLRLHRSEAPLRESQRAFADGDCRRASDRARGSTARLRTRPEPYLLVGYCALRWGQGQTAARAFTSAVERDPRNWEMHYALGLGRAAAGLDPRPQLRIARRLNPLEILPGHALRLFHGDDPRIWKRRASRPSLVAR